MSAVAVDPREEARQRNRAAFPGLAAIMDDVRAAFGDDVKLVHGVESGQTVGKPIDTAGLSPARPCAPPSPSCEKFRLQALKEYAAKFHRQGQAGDVHWMEWYGQYIAKHWQTFRYGTQKE